MGSHRDFQHVSHIGVYVCEGKPGVLKLRSVWVGQHIYSIPARTLYMICGCNAKSNERVRSVGNQRGDAGNLAIYQHFASLEQGAMFFTTVSFFEHFLA